MASPPLPTPSSSSSSEYESSDNEEYPYYIVEFFKRGRKTKKSFDVVASKWLTYNKTKGKLECRYMAPTREKYSEEDCKLIRDLASMNADAPESWLKFNCKVKGQAKTFEAAEKKADFLDTKDYVFTSDSQVEPKQKEKEIEMLIKQKSLKEQQAKTKAAMEAMKFSSKIQENKGENSHSSDNQRSQPKPGTIKKAMKCSSRIQENKEGDKLNISKPLILETIKKSAPEIKETSLSGNSGKNINWEKRKKPETNDLATPELMKSIDSRLASLENQMKIIICLLCENKNHGNQSVAVAFSRHLEFNLPSKSQEDSNQLNIMLQNSTHFKNLTDSLCFSSNFNLSIGKVLSKMLKICLSRDLAMNLTAQKKMEGKQVIKSTPLCNLLINILKAKLAVENEDVALAVIGEALGGAKDWDGKRKERVIKNAE